MHGWLHFHAITIEAVYALVAISPSVLEKIFLQYIKKTKKQRSSAKYYFFFSTDCLVISQYLPKSRNRSDVAFAYSFQAASLDIYEQSPLFAHKLLYNRARAADAKFISHPVFIGPRENRKPRPR